MDLRKIAKQIISWGEERTGTLWTFHLRPLRASSFTATSGEITNCPTNAVVIQGGLLPDHNFTLETIRFYKKIFPQSEIIVSTWDDSPSEQLGAIQKENVHLVTSKKPEFFGPLNCNLQFISTRAGIKKAGELGAKFVLKTRTDQRIYGINTLRFLLAITEMFPLSKDVFGQEKRIIGLSTATRKYRNYHFSDQLQFGTITDMKKYWDIPLIPREKVPEKFGTEEYLFKTFLNATGWDLKHTHEDSLRAYASRICIVDKPAIDIYWHKYTRLREYRCKDLNYRNLDFKKEVRDFYFSDWCASCAKFFSSNALL